MRGGRRALVLTWFVHAALVSAQPTASSARQFQEAVTLMEARGDCRSASPIFARIADGGDRALAARALVFLGVCQERLGRAEAAATYQRVIEGFAEHGRAVSDARRRLALLSRREREPVARQPAVRRAWERVPDDFSRAGLVSSGGQVFAYVTKNGRVALGDLRTGRPLRELPSGTGGIVGQSPVPSADGESVAYTWQAAANQPVEVRVTSAGQQPRTVYRAPSGEALIIRDWRAGHLLAESTAASGDLSLWLISLRGQPPLQIALLDQAPVTAKLSPDGVLVVYDVPGEAPSERDLSVRRVTDGREQCRLNGPSDDFAGGWSPAGDRVVFVSDRLGSASLWSSGVKQCGSPADAELLLRDVGVFVNLLGITDEGAVYYPREVGTSDVYVQTLDEGGQPTGVARRATRGDVGGNMYPTFGSSELLTFVMQISASQVPGFTRLAHYDLTSGAVTPVPTDLLFQVVQPRWSPDGRTLLAVGGKKGRYGYFSVDAKTGSSTPLLTFPFMEDRRVGGARWCPDSRSFAYLLSGTERVVRRYSLDSGKDEHWVTFSGVTSMNDMAVSPAGTSLAAVVRRGSAGALMVIEGEAKPREILTFDQSSPITSVVWAPSGRELLYSRRLAYDTRAELWRISLDGVAPIPMGIVAQDMRELAISPDGRKLAYTAGTPMRMPWVIENVVPPRRR